MEKPGGKSVLSPISMLFLQYLLSTCVLHFYRNVSPLKIQLPCVHSLAPATVQVLKSHSDHQPPNWGWEVQNTHPHRCVCWMERLHAHTCVDRAYTDQAVLHCFCEIPGKGEGSEYQQKRGLRAEAGSSSL
jgi:hypothetical protein